MLFKDLSPKVQLCLVAGMLSAIEGELHKHKSKIAGTVNGMMRNVGVEASDLDGIIDGLSEEESAEMFAYGEYRNTQI